VVTELCGGDHERLVLDRAGAQQHLPVAGLAGRAGEVGRDGHDPRALERLDPVQLGEAQVVTDGQADRGAVLELGQDDLVARLVGVGLEVLAALDLDVEQVDLAVDGLEFPVRSDVDAGVGALRVAVAALHQRSRNEVDPQLLREALRPAHCRVLLDGRGGTLVVVAVAAHVGALGQQHELRAVRGGGAGQSLGAGEIRVAVLRGIELYGCGAQCCPPPVRAVD
jgi:hypothetical protein